MRKDNEWFDDENESYKDYKIKGKDVVFPSHKEDQNGECITFHISELNNK